VIERFNRTLKEQCVYLHRFESLARAIIAAFIERYNRQWLIERLGHRTPAQARADATRSAA
jgi:putative transposase